jgi:exodeoxyribonuclease VII large subunit
MHLFERLSRELGAKRTLAELLSPTTVLRRGYAIVRDVNGVIVRTSLQAKKAGELRLQFSDDTIQTKVKEQ